MLTKSVSTRVRVGSLGLAVIGCATVVSALSAPAQAYSPHGAIAVSRDHGDIGEAWNYGSKEEADQAAMDKCNRGDCKVLISFTVCGAVADKRGHRWGGYGPDRDAAEQDALNRNGGGRIISSVCND